MVCVYVVCDNDSLLHELSVFLRSMQIKPQHKSAGLFARRGISYGMASSQAILVVRNAIFGGPLSNFEMSLLGNHPNEIINLWHGSVNDYGYLPLNNSENARWGIITHLRLLGCAVFCDGAKWMTSGNLDRVSKD